MTPADIRNKKFEKGMGGYKTDEVNVYLMQVADYVESLEAENKDFVDKMEVLADKLEQYREDEESLRAALIGAQKLGNSVVRESQRKAEAIIAQAVRKAEDMVADAQRGIDKEALALKRMQRDVAGFREKIIQLYTQHLEMIKKLPTDDDFLIKPAQIQYTPPTLESVDMREIVNVDGAPSTLDGESEADGELVALHKAAKPSDGQKDDAQRRPGKKFEQLDEFFGEDKPVERQ